MQWAELELEGKKTAMGFHQVAASTADVLGRAASGHGLYSLRAIEAARLVLTLGAPWTTPWLEQFPLTDSAE